jgi:pimeloyl-ACP methyl ester carboxylesterase
MTLHYQLDTATRRFHYIEHGQGPDLILLHGNGAHAMLYQSMIEHLGQSFRVIVPDLPGYGRTPAKHYRVDDYIADVSDFVHRHVSDDAVCIGHSLGGLISYLMHRQGGFHWQKLVWMEAALFTELSPLIRFLLPGYALYTRYHRHNPKHIRNAVREIALNYDQSESFIKERFIESYTWADRRVQAMFFRNYPRYLPLDFSGFDMPILCVRGEKQSYISRVTEAFYPLLPDVAGTRKVMVEDAGHFLIGENEPPLFDALDQFL